MATAPKKQPVKQPAKPVPGKPVPAVKPGPTPVVKPTPGKGPEKPISEVETIDPGGRSADVVPDWVTSLRGGSRDSMHSLIAKRGGKKKKKKVRINLA